MKLFDDKSKKFFTGLVTSNIKYREENNVKVNDVINLLMEAKKEGSIVVENDQAYESAGFATVMESEDIKKTSNKVGSKWNIFPSKEIDLNHIISLQNGTLKTWLHNACCFS